MRWVEVSKRPFAALNIGIRACGLTRPGPGANWLRERMKRTKSSPAPISTGSAGSLVELVDRLENNLRNVAVKLLHAMSLHPSP